MTREWCLLQCLNDAGDLVRLPLQLSNLGNTSSSDYKLEPGNPALYTSSVLAPVLQQRLQCLEPGVQESKELHASLEHLLQEQLSLLSEAQVQRSKKVQQLQMLRSICYQNGIIPDIEWPSRLGLKKKEESAAKKPHDNASKPVPSQEAPLDITNAVVAAAAQVVGTKNGSQNITTRRNPNKRTKLKPHSKASTATPAIDATKSATEESATIADPSLQADNDGDNNAIDGLQKSLTRLAVKNGIGNKNGSTKSSPLRPASRGSRGSPSKSRSPAPRSITPRTGNSPAPRCSPRPKPRPGSACKVSTGTQSMPETVTEENPATNSLGPETNSPLEPAAKAKRRLDSGSPSKSSRSSSESPVKQAWRS
ncbi:serine/arginine repetitive matrix protein 1-like [Hyalella azteca]|uniref:Serine/arginine repetitive matrix protein 1-like n=1 Tax=Hyalella azteca TaxID=294128 RepID=A0A8B7N8T4_HYAAZ|nr:serine/arginine repetitive matrix protein 1-like [Hyalella azteca]